jgi:molybdopterin-guanine dinucleotide biosynthesis protein A
MKKATLAIIIFKFFTPAEQRLFAQSANNGFTIENYYKIKYGHADEFIALWKKYHYPLLKKLLDKGDILSIRAEAPLLYNGHDSRWDFKVVLTFKNEHLAFDCSIIEALKKRLFPDQEAYKQAEQNRLELLLAHWHTAVDELILN